jgi:hypothetical protein
MQAIDQPEDVISSSIALDSDRAARGGYALIIFAVFFALFGDFVWCILGNKNRSHGVPARMAALMLSCRKPRNAWWVSGHQLIAALTSNRWRVDLTHRWRLS